MTPPRTLENLITAERAATNRYVRPETVLTPERVAEALRVLGITPPPGRQP